MKKISERCIHGNIIIDHKDGKITLTYPEYGFKDTFETTDEAIETLIYSIVELLQQTNFNIRDVIGEKWDKVQVFIKTSVISEIN